MEHDIGRLGGSAARMTSDLRRSLGEAWRCSVAEDYTLTMTGPDVEESVPLDREVEDEDWYVRPEFSQQEQAEALDAAADDLVANTVIEVLGMLGMVWPTCPQHGQVVGNCDGSWYCSGADEHDLGLLGSLGQSA